MYETEERAKIPRKDCVKSSIFNLSSVGLIMKLKNKRNEMKFGVKIKFMTIEETEHLLT